MSEQRYDGRPVDYWIVSIGDDAFDVPTLDDAIHAARDLVLNESVYQFGSRVKADEAWVYPSWGLAEDSDEDDDPGMVVVFMIRRDASGRVKESKSPSSAARMYASSATMLRNPRDVYLPPKRHTLRPRVRPDPSWRSLRHFRRRSLSRLTLSQLEAMTDPELDAYFESARRKINKALSDLQSKGAAGRQAQKAIVAFVESEAWWELRPVGLSQDEIDILQYWSEPLEHADHPESMIDRRFWHLLS